MIFTDGPYDDFYTLVGRMWSSGKVYFNYAFCLQIIILSSQETNKNRNYMRNIPARIGACRDWFSCECVNFGSYTDPQGSSLVD